MSTKIYNGLIFRNASLEDALCRLKAIRDQCVELGQSFVAREVARRIALEKDLAENYCRIDKGDQSTFWGIHDEVLKAQVDVIGRGIRAVDWDATLNICLIPSQGNVLALFYCEGGLGYREILKAAEFDDFHFRNSVDRPSDVTAAEWQERHDAWLQALPSGTRPSDVGLTYDVVSWDCLRIALFDKELVASCAPSLEVRRREVAMRLTELGPGERLNLNEVSMTRLFRRLVELAKLREESVILSENPFSLQ
ncbi:hypothetical protein RMI87_30010 [Pseudomonas aeruginosa]|uniref:hypothetical protein n=1 Tax=Pseudomonas aeruginosa TaxID=287 RepID=UPI00287F12C0|nr:hypothetical protein [Pseudomonas aeruginosa]MDS9917742.1 hypothetical protein [Pseudomonas aeruginosa]